MGTKHKSIHNNHRFQDWLIIIINAPTHINAIIIEYYYYIYIATLRQNKTCINAFNNRQGTHGWFSYDQRWNLPLLISFVIVNHKESSGFMLIHI